LSGKQNRKPFGNLCILCQLLVCYLEQQVDNSKRPVSEASLRARHNYTSVSVDVNVNNRFTSHRVMKHLYCAVCLQRLSEAAAAERRVVQTVR